MARSMTGSGIFPPPKERDSKCGTSALDSPSSASTIRCSIVGTTNAVVTFSARASSIQASGVKLASCTTRRPEYTELNTAAIPAT